MTILHRIRRPRPFVRFNRDQYEQMITGLRDEITRQIAARRAHRDWGASWLEQRAAAYREDATHIDRTGSRPADGALTAVQRRTIAHELEQLAIDFERGPDA